jgi:hypothetical protein
MEHCMKENGNSLMLKDRENSIMSMVISTRVNGQIIKLMDTVFILMQKALDMKDHGKMTNNMAKE